MTVLRTDFSAMYVCNYGYDVLLSHLGNNLMRIETINDDECFVNKKLRYHLALHK